MNAVIYARYSSSSQTEQSIEGQLRVCKEYAQRKDYVIVNEYIDRATTGTNDNRPAFLQMVADSDKKQFDIILVYKLDRFSRNKYDSVVYKHKLKQSNIRVESATENITDSPEGVLLEGLLEMFAEMYSKDLSQKVKRGIKESILKGNYIGGHVLYGYKVEDKKMVIDQATAPAIVYMFEQYANGVPKKQIIEELNKKGYSNRRGKPITINTFQNNLRQSKYAGIYESQSGVINNEYYPAIISKQLFSRVQKMLDKNKHAPASQKSQDQYLLTGKCFCGYCGANMVGVSGKSHTNKLHRYYTCSNRCKHKTCHKENENKERLELDVVKDTLEYVLNPDSIKQITKRVLIELNKNPITKRVAELEKQILNINNTIDKDFEIFYNTESQELRQRIDSKMKTLEIQKQDLQAQINRLKLGSVLKTENDITKAFEMYLEICNSEEEYQRKIINQFVNAVFVFDNDNYLIYYNLPEEDTMTFEELQKDLKDNNITPQPRPSKARAKVRNSSVMPRQNTPNTNYTKYIYSRVFGIYVKRSN